MLAIKKKFENRIKIIITTKAVNARPHQASLLLCDNCKLFHVRLKRSPLYTCNKLATV